MKTVVKRGSGFLLGLALCRAGITDESKDWILLALIFFGGLASLIAGIMIGSAPLTEDFVKDGIIYDKAGKRVAKVVWD